MKARALAAALVLVVPARALAVYQCGPQKDTCPCGAANPYPCCSNGGNCTWFAWHAACCNWGVGLPGWGNANQWAGNARARGYDVRDCGAPVTNAISCKRSGTYGHVAWVTRLNGGGGIHVQEQNCWGNYGMREWDYGRCYFDGGIIARPGQVQCNPGDSQTQGCGRCGAQSRGCGGDGRWGGWGGCGGEGPCSPGQSETRPCGRCGTSVRTCGGGCQWGGWSACAGEGPCAPGERETEGCGACGTRARTCGAGCAWPDWGACEGEGECMPKASQTERCGDCGTRTRRCDDACAWDAFSACEGPDPREGGAEVACDTGSPGVCARGALECEGGSLACAARFEPAPESCNGLDDDCDGATDDGACEELIGTSPLAWQGCRCGGSGSAAAPGALLLLLACARARRCAPRP